MQQSLPREWPIVPTSSRLSESLVRRSAASPAEGGHAGDVLANGDDGGEQVMQHLVLQHQVHHRLHVRGHPKVLVVVSCSQALTGMSHMQPQRMTLAGLSGELSTQTRHLPKYSLYLRAAAHIKQQSSPDLAHHACCGCIARCQGDLRLYAH